MRRAVPVLIMICALSLAGLAQGDYRASSFAGKIGPPDDRHRLTFTYEKLSKTKRLVNDARFKNLPVQCTAPDSGQLAEGVLAEFNQPSAAWVVNKRKKIGGRKDFRKMWKGKGVPIDPPGGETRFTRKRATFAGKFRKGFTRARGTFAIRWNEVHGRSREVVYRCQTETSWNAHVAKGKKAR